MTPGVWLYFGVTPQGALDDQGRSYCTFWQAADETYASVMWTRNMLASSHLMETSIVYRWEANLFDREGRNMLWVTQHKCPTKVDEPNNCP